MAFREKDIQLIGGHSPCITAVIKQDETTVEPQKNYGGAMCITRCGKALKNLPEDGYVAKFYYDRSIRRFRAVIPKKQSLEMVGNYTYHLQVKTPDGVEMRPEYGRINFIQGMEAKQ